MTQNRFNKLLRLTAFFTCLFFTVNTLAWGAGPLDLKPSAAFDASRPLSLSFPDDLGIIREQSPVYAAPSPEHPLIIHIQDAHCNYSAQKNTAEILKILKKKFGMKHVFVEGAAGRLDARYLRFSENKTLNRKAAEILAKMGEMTGSDLYLFENPDGLDFTGIENPLFYRQEIQELKKALHAENESRKWIRSERAKLEREISRLGNKGLLTALRMNLDLENDKTSFLKITASLDDLSRRYLGRDLREAKEQREFPNLMRLVRLRALEGEVSVDKAREEVRGIKSEKLSGFFDASLSPREMLEEIYSNLKSSGFDFDKYPQFSRYAKQRIFESELDSSGLFDEVSRLTNLLIAKLAKTEDEKKSAENVKNFKLTSKLLLLELTREDWKGVVGAGLVPAQNGQGQALLLQNAFRFYQLAEQRETEFLKIIRETIKKEKLDRAVIITGGFHTDAIKENFLKSHSSYSVISPRVIGDSRANYAKTMLGRSAREIEISEAAPVPQALDPITTKSLGVDTELRNGIWRGAVGIVNAKSLGGTAKQQGAAKTGYDENKTLENYFAHLRRLSVPEEAREGFGQIFPTNEARLAEAIPLVQKLTRAASRKFPKEKFANVGVSLDQNFGLLAKSDAQSAYLLDIDPINTLLLLPYLGLVFGRSQTRAEFLANLYGKELIPIWLPNLRTKNFDELWKQVQDMEFLSLGDHRSFQRGLAKKIAAHLNSSQFNGLGMTETEVIQYVEDYFPWGRHEPSRGGWLEALARETWLASEEDYQKVRSAWMNGKIIGVIGNVWGPAMKKIVSELDQNGESLLFWYVSNVPVPQQGVAEWRKYLDENFSDNQKKLAQVISIPAGGLFSAVNLPKIQPLSDFADTLALRPLVEVRKRRAARENGGKPKPDINGGFPLFDHLSPDPDKYNGSSLGVPSMDDLFARIEDAVKEIDDFVVGEDSGIQKIVQNIFGSKDRKTMTAVNQLAVLFRHGLLLPLQMVFNDSERLIKTEKNRNKETLKRAKENLKRAKEDLKTFVSLDLKEEVKLKKKSHTFQSVMEYLLHESGVNAVQFQEIYEDRIKKAKQKISDDLMKHLSEIETVLNEVAERLETSKAESEKTPAHGNSLGARYKRQLDDYGIHWREAIRRHDLFTDKHVLHSRELHDPSFEGYLPEYGVSPVLFFDKLKGFSRRDFQEMLDDLQKTKAFQAGKIKILPNLYHTIRLLAWFEKDPVSPERIEAFRKRMSDSAAETRPFSMPVRGVNIDSMRAELFIQLFPGDEYIHLYNRLTNNEGPGVMYDANFAAVMKDLDEEEYGDLLEFMERWRNWDFGEVTMDQMHLVHHADHELTKTLLDETYTFAKKPIVERITTVGYADLTISKFFHVLKQFQIDAVIDVREIAYSRKPGYAGGDAKSLLALKLKNAGVQYVHVPQLGAPKDIRDQFYSDRRINRFRDAYLAHIEPNRPLLERLVKWLSGKRAVILGVPDDPEEDHRSILLEELLKLCEVKERPRDLNFVKKPIASPEPKKKKNPDGSTQMDLFSDAPEGSSLGVGMPPVKIPGSVWVPVKIAKNYAGQDQIDKDFKAGFFKWDDQGQLWAPVVRDPFFEPESESHYGAGRYSFYGRSLFGFLSEDINSVSSWIARAVKGVGLIRPGYLLFSHRPHAEINTHRFYGGETRDMADYSAEIAKRMHGEYEKALREKDPVVMLAKEKYGIHGAPTLRPLYLLELKQIPVTVGSELEYRSTRSALRKMNIPLEVIRQQVVFVYEVPLMSRVSETKLGSTDYAKRFLLSPLLAFSGPYATPESAIKQFAARIAVARHLMERRLNGTFTVDLDENSKKPVEKVRLVSSLHAQNVVLSGHVVDLDSAAIHLKQDERVRGEMMDEFAQNETFALMGKFLGISKSKDRQIAWNVFEEVFYAGKIAEVSRVQLAVTGSSLGAKKSLDFNPEMEFFRNIEKEGRLEQLTPNQKEAIILVMEGYRNAQIAKKLKISKQAVSQRIAFAYGRLERNINKPNPEPVKRSPGSNLRRNTKERKKQKLDFIRQAKSEGLFPFLTEKPRKILEMQLENVPHKAIADELGMSLDGVSQMSIVALRMLKDMRDPSSTLQIFRLAQERGLLASLDERTRQIIELFLNAISRDEIAIRFGVSSDRVRVKIAEARSELEKTMMPKQAPRPKSRALSHLELFKEAKKLGLFNVLTQKQAEVAEKFVAGKKLQEIADILNLNSIAAVLGRLNGAQRKLEIAMKEAAQAKSLGDVVLAKNSKLQSVRRRILDSVVFAGLISLTACVSTPERPEYFNFRNLDSDIPPPFHPGDIENQIQNALNRFRALRDNDAEVFSGAATNRLLPALNYARLKNDDALARSIFERADRRIQSETDENFNKRMDILLRIWKKYGVIVMGIHAALEETKLLEIERNLELLPERFLRAAHFIDIWEHAPKDSNVTGLSFPCAGGIGILKNSDFLALWIHEYLHRVLVSDYQTLHRWTNFYARSGDDPDNFIMHLSTDSAREVSKPDGSKILLPDFHHDLTFFGQTWGQSREILFSRMEESLKNGKTLFAEKVLAALELFSFTENGNEYLIGYLMGSEGHYNRSFFPVIRNASGRIALISDPLNQTRVRFEYDANGKPSGIIRETDPMFSVIPFPWGRSAAGRSLGEASENQDQDSEDALGKKINLNNLAVSVSEIQGALSKLENLRGKDKREARKSVAQKIDELRTKKKLQNFKELQREIEALSGVSETSLAEIFYLNVPRKISRKSLAVILLGFLGVGILTAYGLTRPAPIKPELPRPVPPAIPVIPSAPMPTPVLTAPSPIGLKYVDPDDLQKYLGANLRFIQSELAKIRARRNQNPLPLRGIKVTYIGSRHSTSEIFDREVAPRLEEAFRLAPARPRGRGGKQFIFVQDFVPSVSVISNVIDPNRQWSSKDLLRNISEGTWGSAYREYGEQGLTLFRQWESGERPRFPLTSDDPFVGRLYEWAGVKQVMIRTEFMSSGTFSFEGLSRIESRLASEAFHAGNFESHRDHLRLSYLYLLLESFARDLDLQNQIRGIHQEYPGSDFAIFMGIAHAPDIILKGIENPKIFRQGNENSGEETNVAQRLLSGGPQGITDEDIFKYAFFSGPFGEQLDILARHGIEVSSSWEEKKLLEEVLKLTGEKYGSLENYFRESTKLRRFAPLQPFLPVLRKIHEESRGRSLGKGAEEKNHSEQVPFTGWIKMPEAVHRLKRELIEKDPQYKAPESQRLVTRMPDGNLAVTDPKATKIFGRFSLPEHAILLKTALNADGDKLAAAYKLGDVGPLKLVLVDIEGNKLINEFSLEDGRAEMHLALNRDGSQLAVQADKQGDGSFIHIYETKTGILWRWLSVEAWISNIRFSSDGHYLFVRHGEGSQRTYSTFNLADMNDFGNFNSDAGKRSWNANIRKMLVPDTTYEYFSDWFRSKPGKNPKEEKMDAYDWITAVVILPLWITTSILIKLGILLLNGVVFLINFYKDRQSVKKLKRLTSSENVSKILAAKNRWLSTHESGFTLPDSLTEDGRKARTAVHLFMADDMDDEARTKGFLGIFKSISSTEMQIYAIAEVTGTVLRLKKESERNRVRELMKRIKDDEEIDDETRRVAEMRYQELLPSDLKGHIIASPETSDDSRREKKKKGRNRASEGSSLGEIIKPKQGFITQVMPGPFADVIGQFAYMLLSRKTDADTQKQIWQWLCVAAQRVEALIGQVEATHQLRSKIGALFYTLQSDAAILSESSWQAIFGYLDELQKELTRFSLRQKSQEIFHNRKLVKSSENLEAPGLILPKKTGLVTSIDLDDSWHADENLIVEAENIPAWVSSLEKTAPFTAEIQAGNLILRSKLNDKMPARKVALVIVDYLEIPAAQNYVSIVFKSIGTKSDAEFWYPGPFGFPIPHETFRKRLGDFEVQVMKDPNRLVYPILQFILPGGRSVIGFLQPHSNTHVALVTDPVFDKRAPRPDYLLQYSNQGSILGGIAIREVRTDFLYPRPILRKTEDSWVPFQIGNFIVAPVGFPSFSNHPDKGKAPFRVQIKDALYGKVLAEFDEAKIKNIKRFYLVTNGKRYPEPERLYAEIVNPAQPNLTQNLPIAVSAASLGENTQTEKIYAAFETTRKIFEEAILNPSSLGTKHLEEIAHHVEESFSMHAFVEFIVALARRGKTDQAIAFTGEALKYYPRSIVLSGLRKILSRPQTNPFLKWIVFEAARFAAIFQRPMFTEKRQSDIRIALWDFSNLWQKHKAITEPIDKFIKSELEDIRRGWPISFAAIIAAESTLEKAEEAALQISKPGVKEALLAQISQARELLAETEELVSQKSGWIERGNFSFRFEKKLRNAGAKIVRVRFNNGAQHFEKVIVPSGYEQFSGDIIFTDGQWGLSALSKNIYWVWFDKEKNDITAAIDGGPKGSSLGVFQKILKREIKQYGKLPLSDHAQTHVENTRKMILEGARGLKGTALILGVEDIEPLEELARQFDRLILVNFTEEGMRDAVSKLPKKLRSKIETRKMDINGVTDQVLKTARKIIRQAGSRVEAERKIAEFILNIRPSEINIEEGRADYVVSSLLMSQLTVFLKRALSSGIGRIYKQSGDFSPTLNLAFEKLEQTVEEEHLKNLNRWTAPNGRIYFADTDYLMQDIYEASSKKKTYKSMTVILQNMMKKTGKILNPIKRKSWKWVLADQGLGENRMVHYYRVRAGIYLPRKTKAASLGKSADSLYREFVESLGLNPEELSKEEARDSKLFVQNLERKADGVGRVIRLADYAVKRSDIPVMGNLFDRVAGIGSAWASEDAASLRFSAEKVFSDLTKQKVQESDSPLDFVITEQIARNPGAAEEIVEVASLWKQSKIVLLWNMESSSAFIKRPPHLEKLKQLALKHHLYIEDRPLFETSIAEKLLRDLRPDASAVSFEVLNDRYTVPQFGKQLTRVHVDEEALAKSRLSRKDVMELIARFSRIKDEKVREGLLRFVGLKEENGFFIAGAEFFNFLAQNYATYQSIARAA